MLSKVVCVFQIITVSQLAYALSSTSLPGTTASQCALVCSHRKDDWNTRPAHLPWHLIPEPSRLQFLSQISRVWGIRIIPQLPLQQSKLPLCRYFNQLNATVMMSCASNHNWKSSRFQLKLCVLLLKDVDVFSGKGITKTLIRKRQERLLWLSEFHF